MARVAVVKPYPEYAKMIAALIKEGGHEVLLETPPVDWERIIRFKPQVLILGLFRVRGAFNRAIDNFDSDVLGHEIIEQVLQYPVIQIVPTLILGNAVEKPDIPVRLAYDAFLIFPDEMPNFMPTLEALSHKVKSRRQIAPYVCPTCQGRLTFTTSDKDLFCPRCHTVVAIIDDSACIAQDAHGESIPCELDQIRPPGPLPPKPDVSE